MTKFGSVQTCWLKVTLTKVMDIGVTGAGKISNSVPGPSPENYPYFYYFYEFCLE